MKKLPASVKRAGAWVAVGAVLATGAIMAASPKAHAQDGKKPNILIIWGDDIGQTNVSSYSRGMMGYRTPNIDRIAEEGMMFTDYYAEQSCTAGRSSFITGQSVFRTGLSKVGLPNLRLDMRPINGEQFKQMIGRRLKRGMNGDRSTYLICK